MISKKAAAGSLHKNSEEGQSVSIEGVKVTKAKPSFSGGDMFGILGYEHFLPNLDCCLTWMAVAKHTPYPATLPDFNTIKKLYNKSLQF